jgi:hypothetical protein
MSGLKSWAKGRKYDKRQETVKKEFDMDKLMTILTLVLGISLTLGCAQREMVVIPADVPEDYPQEYLFIRSVGENIIHLDVDHRKGRMYVLVTDIYEEPMHLPLQKIDAKIITPDGTMRALELYTPKIRMPSTGVRRRPLYTAYYSRQADWLRNIHEFLVELEVPIKDKIYVVSFEYKTSPEGDVHHWYQ